MRKIFVASYLFFFIVFLVACTFQSTEVNVEKSEGVKTNHEVEETVSKAIEKQEAQELEKEEGSETKNQNKGEVTGFEFISPYTFEYPDAVRGIYVTSHSAGGSRFEELLQLLNTTDLNAMVIDIKEDKGYLTFRPAEDSPYFPYSQPYIKDIKALLQTLEDHQIYPIARIVVFKDSVMANEKPEWSFLEDGHVWKNRRGESFVNPFLKEVWEYNVGIAKLAAELGFQEIQFDYVRFPEGFENRDEILQYALGEYDSRKPEKLIQLETIHQQDKIKYEDELKELIAAKEKEQIEEELENLKLKIDTLEKNKPQEPQLSSKEYAVQLRVDAVTDFVAYAKQELRPYNVNVSVDIFGYTATLREAPGIGQNFTRISNHVDVISSMIYPSHWTSYFGIPKPDLEPYRLVQEYAKVEKGKLSQLENPPVSRPWIQDFTATWLGKGNYKRYGTEEVEAQIRALNENGIQEFLLWNPNNRYTPHVNYLPLVEK